MKSPPQWLAFHFTEEASEDDGGVVNIDRERRKTESYRLTKRQANASRENPDRGNTSTAND